MASASRIRNVRYVIFWIRYLLGCEWAHLFLNDNARARNEKGRCGRAVHLPHSGLSFFVLLSMFRSFPLSRRVAVSVFRIRESGCLGILPRSLFFKTSLLDLSWRRERRTMGTRRTTHQLRAHATNILFLSITSDDNNSLRKRNAPSSATRLSRNRR